MTDALPCPQVGGEEQLTSGQHLFWIVGGLELNGKWGGEVRKQACDPEPFSVVVGFPALALVTLQTS